MIKMEKEIAKNLNKEAGYYESFIDSIIPIYNILKYLLSCGLQGEAQKYVVGALAYFVAPDKTIMPESEYGTAYMYVPYIYIGAYALREVDDSTPFGLNDEFMNEVQIALKKCDEILTDDEKNKIFDRVIPRKQKKLADLFENLSPAEAKRYRRCCND